MVLLLLVDLMVSHGTVGSPMIFIWHPVRGVGLGVCPLVWYYEKKKNRFNSRT